MFFSEFSPSNVSDLEFSPFIMLTVCGTVLGAAMLILRTVPLEEIGNRLERALHYIK